MKNSSWPFYGMYKKQSERHKWNLGNKTGRLLTMTTLLHTWHSPSRSFSITQTSSGSTAILQTWSLAGTLLFLFPKLRACLKECQFGWVEEIQQKMLKELIQISSKSCTECSVNWKYRWNGCINAGGNYFKADTIYLSSYTRDTICRIRNTNVLYTRYTSGNTADSLTSNVCAATCRTRCLVRGMLRHLELPQHQNWWQTVTDILYLKLPLQVQPYSQLTYKKLLITVSWEASQCDRQGKIFFLGKHWIKESCVKNKGCWYQAGYHNWLWWTKVMSRRVTAE